MTNSLVGANSKPQGTAFLSLDRGLQTVVMAVPTAALALLSVLILKGAAGPSAGQILILLVAAILALVADLRPVQIAPHRNTSFSSVPILIAVLLLPPLMSATMAGLSTLAANTVLRRPWYNSLYNAGLTVVASVAAAAIAQPPIGPTGPSVLRGAVAALVYSGTAIALATAASARQEGRAAQHALRDARRESWPQALALDATALAVAILLVSSPWAALLPLGVLPMLYRMNRALEGELHARDQVATVLGAQRRFLTDVSHNVGNPLGTILLTLSLLRSAPLSASDLAALRDARTEVGRLTELFRRLRILAETDEEIPLRVQRVDLVNLAAEVVQAYSVSARRKSLALTSEEGAPSTVSADPDLLRQAVANLVENAIRHSPKGGRVSIVLTSHKRHAWLEVRDQGPGIPADRLPHIFDRFERGPNGGSGLGLSIVRSVIERHGGQVEVETEPGDTRFRILLPLP